MSTIAFTVLTVSCLKAQPICFEITNSLLLAMWWRRWRLKWFLTTEKHPSIALY